MAGASPGMTRSHLTIVVVPLPGGQWLAIVHSHKTGMGLSCQGDTKEGAARKLLEMVRRIRREEEPLDGC